MAERTRLTDGVDTINFSPSQGGLQRPDRFFETVKVSLGGTRYTYERGDSKRYERVRTSFISPTDAAKLNAWVKNRTPLTWTPDFPNDPIITYPATLINESRPMQMGRFRHDTFYEGELLILET